MKGYIAFTKKEFLENIKNYRFLILFVIYLVFGITGVLFAKFTPQLLLALAPDIKMETTPVALDAWKQFYKNIPSVGFSALLILYGSCLSNEYSRGTLVLMVTKGLSRTSVILSKYTVAAITMTISYWISFAVSYGYTAYLWKDSDLQNVIFSAFILWVIGFLYLAILMLGCVLFRQVFTSILFCGGVVAALSVLSLIKPIKNCSPFTLTTRNIDIISGVVSPSAFIIPICISILLTIIFMLIAMSAFQRKQL